MGRSWKSVFSWLWVALLAWVMVGADPYTAPDGDLNRDGVVDAIDLQCEVVLFEVLQGAADVTEDVCATDGDCPDSYSCRVGPASFKLCFPGCLSPEVVFGESAGAVCDDPEEDSPECLGTVAKMNADLNCDGGFTNVDFQFLVSLLMGKAGGIGTADVDGDGQLNFCDPDSDGDGVEDLDDCAALEPGVGVCFDGDPCTLDICEDGGCVFPPTTGPLCDDEDACTTGDVCSGGVCAGAGSLDCDDGNICTTDTCVPATGCVYTNNTASCNDGNSCTTSDQCSGGVCVGSGSLNCSDGNPCTNDSCNPASGCTHSTIYPCCGNNVTESGEQCDDGNQTSGDGCDASCHLEGGGCVVLGQDVRTLEQPPSDWQLDYCNSDYCENTPTVIPSGWHIATLAEVAHLTQFVEFGSCGAYGICGAHWYGGNLLISGCSNLHYTCTTGGCTAYTDHCYTQVMLIKDGKDGTCHVEASPCVVLGQDVRTLEQPPSDWQLDYCNSDYCENTPTVIPSGWHIATLAEVAHLTQFVEFGSCGAYGICGAHWYGGDLLISGCSNLHYTCTTGGCTAYTTHCYTQVMLVKDGKDGTCHL